MTFIIWALPVLGCTLIITCSAIIRPIREFWQGRFPWLYKLMVCPMCAGWWVGLVASTHNLSLLPAGAYASHWEHFANACAASYICWFSHTVLCALGQGRLLGITEKES